MSYLMATDEKTVTEREFLESWGLYRRLRLAQEWSRPAKLSRVCSECKKETTWGLEKEEHLFDITPLYSLQYCCVDCEKELVVFFVYTDPEYDYQPMRIVASDTWLVGMFPEPSVRISRLLEEHLGDDAQTYKRGLRCLNEGFGIGAVSYIRRVVENKTNELIDIVADLAAAGGAAKRPG